MHLAFNAVKLLVSLQGCVRACVHAFAQVFLRARVSARARGRDGVGRVRRREREEISGLLGEIARNHWSVRRRKIEREQLF
jgi:hypothetical protein